jgi:hypothetical protein
MSTNAEHNAAHNGSRPPSTVQELREQVAEDRRRLAETVTALHHKTDVKERVQEKVHEKVAGTELAVVGLASRAGRAAGGAGRVATGTVGLVRWAATMAGDQVRNLTPQPIWNQVERAGGLARRELRLFIASATVLLAVVTLRRQHHNDSRRS